MNEEIANIRQIIMGISTSLKNRSTIIKNKDRLINLSQNVADRIKTLVNNMEEEE